MEPTTSGDQLLITERNLGIYTHPNFLQRMRKSGIKSSGGISMSSGLTDPLISNPEISSVGRARGRSLGEAQKRRESKEKARKRWDMFKRSSTSSGRKSAALRSNTLSSLPEIMSQEEEKESAAVETMETGKASVTTQSKSMRELLVSDHRVEQAAILMMDSWSGRSEHHGFSHEAVVLYRFLHQSWWYNLYVALISMYMIMGLLPRTLIASNALVFSILEGIILACLSYDLYLTWLLEQPDDENKNLLDDDDENTSSKAFLGITVPDKWTVFRACGIHYGPS